MSACAAGGAGDHGGCSYGARMGSAEGGDALCTGLRGSQRKTLSELVVGAMRCRRASLADMGRSICTGTVAKHNIKRVWRFVRRRKQACVRQASG